MRSSKVHPTMLLLPWLVAAPMLGQLATPRSLEILQTDVGAASEGGDRFGESLAVGDFDGDGILDLAIGIPEEDIGGAVDAGAVAITYGTAGIGLGLGPSQLFHQGRADLLDAAESGDRFGSVLAVGNFDGNSFDDLAIGVPGEDRGAATDAGDVHILYGSANGLTATGDQLFHQNATGVPGFNAADDGFGAALVSGDFDDDTFDDLAIGVPGDDEVAFLADGGAVVVLFGGFQGLAAADAVKLDQDDTNGGLDTVQAGDRFGAALATGDFGDDGITDLYIGVPGEDGDLEDDIGRVMVSFGGDPIPFRDMLRVVSGLDAGDAQGGVLASGDFTGDGDIALVASAVESGSESQGRVWFRDGGFFRALRQGEGGIQEMAEPFDRMGQALATGDFDGDGVDDLAIGVPDENLDDGAPAPKLDAGVVHAIYGGESSLDDQGNQLFSLARSGVGFGDLGNARYGHALAAGDFDGDGVDDLAVGTPGANVTAGADEGLVVILYGLPGIFADSFESGDTTAWSSTVP